MSEARMTPLDSQDDQNYRYSRETWLEAGVDNWTLPPSQNADMMLQMLNLLPPIGGSLLRRWGYRLFLPVQDFGATPTSDSLNG